MGSQIEAVMDRYGVTEEQIGHMVLNLSDLAEKVAEVHKSVMSSPNGLIAWNRGEIFRRTQKMLLWTIRASYPELSDWDIYHMWCFHGETIADAANRVKSGETV